MKELSIPLVAALLAAALTAGAMEVLRAERSPAGTAPAVATPGPRPEEGRAEDVRPALLADPADARTAERLLALEERLARIEVELSRRAVTVPAEALDEGLALDDGSAREFVLDVLETDRTQREEQRSQERRERLEEITLARARELAEELGLGPRDESTVASVLLQEMDRRQATFETMRNGDFEAGSRDLIRSRMAEIDDWKREELVTALGADLAERVLESEQSGRWGRFGGARDRRGGGGGRDGRRDGGGASRE